MAFIVKIIMCNVLWSIWDKLCSWFSHSHIVEAVEQIPLKDLIDKIIVFCEVYSGITYFPYQEQFARRIVRSLLLNDGEEITALFSRQSGKSETVATTVGGCMIIFPLLALMFPDDERLQMFKDGLWVGIFAPSERQAKITYNRLRTRLNSKSSKAILEDPSIDLTFTVSNGQTVTLSNGSFASAISASEGSSIEGETFKLIICEECQDISNYKIRKSIHPMGAAYNASVVKVGTSTTFVGDFYEAIQRNKHEYLVNKGVKNHFEYDWKVVVKYNKKYAKYIEKEKKRLGENSDEFQMSYCVTPETRILTADLRYVPAKDVKIGDKLFGFDEEPPKKYGQRKFKEAIVEDVGSIIRPCYKITLEDGTTVTCSAEHRWLVFTAGSRTEWKQTKDLVSTDRIYRISDVWGKPTLNYKLGYLAAAFDGEGCVSHVDGRVGQICFAQKDNEMLRNVKQFLSDLSFSYGERIDDRSGVHKIYLTGGKYEYYRFLGTVRPKRLLAKFNVNELGTIRCCKQEERDFTHPRVISLDYVGEQEVIPIRTSTRTYVAEGLASHNCLKWILVRGMFVSPSSFEKRNVDTTRGVTSYDIGDKTYVAALDQAKHFDGSVLTIDEVDFSKPVIHETRQNDDGTEEEFIAFESTAVAWFEYQGDYNDQYYAIMDDLKNYNVIRMICDATREESQVDRFKANLDYEVIDFKFTPENKSMVYKTLDREIKSGRAKIVGDELVQESSEYKKFLEQLYGLQKNYKGTRMIVANSSEKVHDDYPDSWAMAVWGCTFPVEKIVAQTEGENPMFARQQSAFYVGRNRLTSRRR